MKNEITITREQYRDAVAKALAGGSMVKDASKKDPQMGFVIMLAGMSVVRDIEDILFGTEEKQEDKENE